MRCVQSTALEVKYAVFLIGKDSSQSLVYVGDVRTREGPGESDMTSINFGCNLFSRIRKSCVVHIILKYSNLPLIYAQSVRTSAA